MNGIAGSSLGRALSTLIRSFGTASASASRTMRRWIPNFRATPLIVPTPNWYSRRIASNSSTSFLLFKPSPSGTRPTQGSWLIVYRVGQFRASKSIAPGGERQDRAGAVNDGGPNSRVGLVEIHHNRRGNRQRDRTS